METQWASSDFQTLCDDSVVHRLRIEIDEMNRRVHCTQCFEIEVIAVTRSNNGKSSTLVDGLIDQQLCDASTMGCENVPTTSSGSIELLLSCENFASLFRNRCVPLRVVA